MASSYSLKSALIVAALCLAQLSNPIGCHEIAELAPEETADAREEGGVGLGVGAGIGAGIGSDGGSGSSGGSYGGSSAGSSAGSNSAGGSFGGSGSFGSIPSLENIQNSFKDLMGFSKKAEVEVGVKGGYESGVQAKESSKYGEPKKESYDIAKVSDWVKLIFNPFELARAISIHFKLPFDKFIEKLGKGMVVGVEPMLYPLVFSVRIIEKVFIPDHCRLKFVCSMGTHFEFAREHVLKFSPNFLEGSLHLKALSEGIVGKNCGTSFPECEPKLKRPYEELGKKEYRD